MKMNRSEKALLARLSSASAQPSDAFRNDLAKRLGIKAEKQRFEWFSLMAGAAFASVLVLVVVVGAASFVTPSASRDLVALQPGLSGGDDGAKQTTMSTGASDVSILSAPTTTQLDMDSREFTAATSDLVLDGRAVDSQTGLGQLVSDETGALYKIVQVETPDKSGPTVEIKRNGQAITAYLVEGQSGLVDTTGETPANMLAYENNGTWIAIFNYGRLTTDEMKQHLESDDF